MAYLVLVGLFSVIEGLKILLVKLGKLQNCIFIDILFSESLSKSEIQG